MPMRWVVGSSVILLVAAALGGCASTRPLPGLTIAEDGRVVRIDAGRARQRIEGKVAAHLAERLPGPRYAVAITPDPVEIRRHNDERDWQFNAVTVEVVVATGAEPPPAADAIIALVAAAMDPHLRDPERLKVVVESAVPAE